MQEINNIGYPFIKNKKSLFNPINDILQNAKSKLLNLLNTNKGQRVLSNNCQFGININELLFQNIGYDNYEKSIKQQLTASINKWIPQIKFIEININSEQHSLIINIKISINQQDFTNIMMEIENE